MVVNGWWWLPIGIGGAFVIRLGYEIYLDRRETGEWIWQAANRLRKAGVKPNESSEGARPLLVEKDKIDAS